MRKKSRVQICLHQATPYLKKTEDFCSKLSGSHENIVVMQHTHMENQSLNQEVITTNYSSDFWAMQHIVQKVHQSPTFLHEVNFQELEKEVFYTRASYPWVNCNASNNNREQRRWQRRWQRKIWIWENIPKFEVDWIALPLKHATKLIEGIKM